MPTADVLRIEFESAEIRHLTAVGAISGVVPILAAARNGPGVGAIQYGNDGLAWRAPGSETFGEPVACSPDGLYVLCDGENADKWIRVQVFGDYLVSGSQAEIALADLYNNAVAGDDVEAAEALAGDESIREITLRNTSDSGLSNVVIWLDAASDPRTEISVDGLTWFAPHTEADGLCLTSIEETATLFLRRTSPAEEASTPKQRVHFCVAFDAL